MEHGFYADPDAAAPPGSIVPVPEAEDRALVHGMIFDELCHGDRSATRPATGMLEVIRPRCRAPAPTA